MADPPVVPPRHQSISQSPHRSANGVSPVPPLPPRPLIRLGERRHSEPHEGGQVPITRGRPIPARAQTQQEFTGSPNFPPQMNSPTTSTPPSHLSHPPPLPVRKQKRTSTDSPTSTPSPRSVRQSTFPPYGESSPQSLGDDNLYVSAGPIVSTRPSPVHIPTRVNNYKPVEEQDWYWGNITKEEVTEVMKDMPDGSFLVRDAARVPGYYTLTLRKSGVNRLIRIMHRDGLYGFAEPLEFQSVVELIEYYRGHSLAPYSPKLDITLIKPVSKQQEGALEESSTESTVLDSLSQIEQQLKLMNQKYNDLQQRFERTNEEIKAMRLEISAQNEIINIMDDGLKEHEKHHEQCPQASKPILLQNYQLLRRRFRQQRDSHDQLKEKLRRTEMTKNALGTELNNLKPEIKRLQAEKANKNRWMNQRGWRNSDINSKIQGIEEEDDDNQEEGLYATYAMLHTYRNEADYQRLKEKILKRPPPLPPSDPRSNWEGDPDATLRRPPAQLPPRNRPRRDTLAVGDKPPPMPLEGYDNFDGQLINYRQMNVTQDIPHFDQSSWINPAISRESSRDTLVGKPNGTFLVRPKGVAPDEVPASEPLHCHTIDIVDGGKFKRIPVFRGPGGGYGFAPPYEFDSLLSLVVYYATNTMEKHNKDLETTLKYPAFAKH